MIEATLAIILSGMCGLYFIHRLTDGGYKGGFKIKIAKIFEISRDKEID